MIRKAIERPVSTLIGALTLVVLGAFSLFRLPVSLLPELERPRLVITADAPGSAREEVLERVTRPLERRLAALGGVTSVESTTGDGFARILVESEWQTDADRLRIEAERRLGGLDVPGVALTVELAAGDPEPIVEVAVFGGEGGARSAFARQVLLPELARLAGAGRVETVGLTPLHPVVRPRIAALAARGLTPADLVERLRSVGAVTAAGRARAGAVVRPVVVREEAVSLAGLRALRIQGPRGESVLGDVADVTLERVPDATFFRLDGEEGALVRVFRAPEANAVALARRVRERVAGISPRAGSGLRLEVAVDRSAEVVGALRELGIAALGGLLLGVAVLRFMLGRWRPTLALALVVPASVFATFAGFYLWGVPLDVVSLAGLALAAGMLVDSAIVVLESIETARARGERTPEVAGTLQIALPVAASFLTTAVVFLPLIYLKGLARAFFGTQAFAIVVTSAVALLFSLTVTPVLARGRWGSGGSVGRSPGRGLYLRLLDGTLARPAGAMILGLATVAVSFLAFALLPRELVPDGPARDLVVRYRLSPDLTPEAARRLGGEVEDRAKQALAGDRVPLLAVQLPENQEGAGDREETGRLALRFPDPETATRARPALAAALARIPDVEAQVEPRTSAMVESIERAGSRLEVVASASTPERARALAGRVEDRLREAAGLAASASRRDRPQPALLLSWDTARLTALGADRNALERQVSEGLGERTAGRAAISGAEPEILVRAADPQNPALLPLAPGSGEVVSLAALARLGAGARPPILTRQDGQPAVRLVFEGTGGGGLHRVDPEAALAGLARAGDEQVAPGGQALELRRAFSQLRLALVLSLILVFLTVAALYESWKTPLVLMTTVPVALGGALGLLALFGQTLNVMSFLGLILLSGIVVNNAIVLVHRMEDHLKDGVEMDEAIRRAGAERYRPILMTTLTTLAGMLPLALLGGEGVELRRALALAVIGGMTTSTFASLLVVPVLYRWTRRARA